MEAKRRSLRHAVAAGLRDFYECRTRANPVPFYVLLALVLAVNLVKIISWTQQYLIWINQYRPIAQEILWVCCAAYALFILAAWRNKAYSFGLAVLGLSALLTMKDIWLPTEGHKLTLLALALAGCGRSFRDTLKVFFLCTAP